MQTVHNIQLSKGRITKSEVNIVLLTLEQDKYCQSLFLTIMRKSVKLMEAASQQNQEPEVMPKRNT